MLFLHAKAGKMLKNIPAFKPPCVLYVREEYKWRVRQWTLLVFIYSSCAATLPPTVSRGTATAFTVRTLEGNETIRSLVFRAFTCSFIFRRPLFIPNLISRELNSDEVSERWRDEARRVTDATYLRSLFGGHRATPQDDWSNINNGETRFPL